VDLTDVECEVGSISSGQGPKVDFWERCHVV
jgi:hypothetical protein